MAVVYDDPALAPHRVLRRRAIEGFFTVATALSRSRPEMREAARRVEVIREVPYGALPEQRLDVYLPRFAPRPLPTLVYYHGGGFTLCSKDTHQGIGLLNAAHAGYAVFMADYRLAPKHRFPAAIEDACAAYRWVAHNAARYGADPRRIVIAGESAGANLALGVAVASSYKRPEPWARVVYDGGVRPAAVQPIMPFLQVSSPGRRAFQHGVGGLALGTLHDIAVAYLGPSRTRAGRENLMADPIRVFEECGAPQRPLPPVFSAVGTADLCLEDVRRLEAACAHYGTPATIHYYANEPHAFTLFAWRPNARRFWRDNIAFLRATAAR